MTIDRLMKTLPAMVLVWALLGGAGGVSAADLGDLQTVGSWDQAAHGIWRAQLGDMTGELRYSDLAAAPPKMDVFGKLR